MVRQGMAALACLDSAPFPGKATALDSKPSASEHLAPEKAQTVTSGLEQATKEPLFMRRVGSGR